MHFRWNPSPQLRWRTLIGVFALVTPTFAVAQEKQSVERGHAFASSRCGGCHSVGLADESPLANAPPFRTLHARYPVEDLEEALAEGIVTGHPGMPQFELDGGQIADFIAYMKTLE
jgi:mono/diheme cytochrome c family protein